jgi:hypothetical protein
MKKYLNKVVELIDIKGYDIDPDVGMRFEVVSAWKEDEGTEHEFYGVLLDFTKFEEYNKQFSKANFYDKYGKATLKWHESNFYPNNNKVEIFTHSIDDMFKILSPVQGEMNTTQQVAYYKELSERYEKGIDKLIEHLKSSIGEEMAEKLSKEVKG